MALEDIRSAMVIAAQTVGAVSGLVIVVGVAIRVRQWQGRAIGNADPAPASWELTDAEIDDATGADEADEIRFLIGQAVERLAEFEDQESYLASLVESLNGALLYMVTVSGDPSQAIAGLEIEDIGWRIEQVTIRLDLREEILANTRDLIGRLNTAIAEAEDGDPEYLLNVLPIIPEGVSDVA